MGDRVMDPNASLRDSSLADALGNANPHRNLMGHIEADDEWRKQNKDFVDQIVKTEEKTGTVNLLRSAGPVSDAFMLSTSAITAICGPVGSSKTIASVKKGLIEAQRIYPGADKVRNYKLGCVTQKYDNQWKATIPSHWKIFAKDLAGSSWTGASPRAAQHILTFEDRFGKIRAIKDFFWEKTANGWRQHNCPLGEGMVDWKAFFAMLASARFQGPVSLHLEYDVAGPTPEALEANTLAAAARDLAFVKARLAEAFDSRRSLGPVAE